MCRDYGKGAHSIVAVSERYTQNSGQLRQQPNQKFTHPVDSFPWWKEERVWRDPGQDPGRHRSYNGNQLSPRSGENSRLMLEKLQKVPQ